MSARRAPVPKHPQSGEINYKVDDKDAVLNQLESDFGKNASGDHLDGVSIDAFDREGWWFNVRASNTEPLLRLNAEARDKDALKKLLNKLSPILGEPAEGH